MTPALWLLLLFAANVALFCLPLLPAFAEMRKRGNAPLFIPADDEAGIGYFAERFRQRLAADWNSATLFEPGGPGDAGYVATLGAAHAALPASIAIQYRMAEGELRGAARLDAAEQPTVVGGTLRLARGTHLLGEAYAHARLDAPGGSVLRAVLCDGELVLGPGSGILRWAHARRIATGDGSRAMGRLSATESLSLGRGCQFERLSAPELRFGGGAAAQDPTPASTRGWVADRRARVVRESLDRLLCNGDVSIPPGSLVDGQLIVRGRLTLGAGCHVRGGIKVHGPVALGDDVVVSGAVFASGDATFGMRCSVDGPVSSAGVVRLGAGCRIGRMEHPTSLVAPVVSVAPGCTCHGSIWARTNGRVDA
ncbi:MAG TPA: hypothetical protein VLM17_00555 [Xanthomonadaceae bacterium]|nr:hypothetical protein [Xanthomonadaceae bacterium]